MISTVPFLQLSGRSHAVLRFCAIHGGITVVLFLSSLAGVANQDWVRFALLTAYMANVFVLCRRWRVVRLEPAFPVVQRRIKLHLLLLRASRGTIFLGLCVAVPVALYLVTQAAKTTWPILVTVLFCPVVLGLKLRWLTVWQRRLLLKSAQHEQSHAHAAPHAQMEDASPALPEPLPRVS